MAAKPKKLFMTNELLRATIGKQAMMPTVRETVEELKRDYDE